MTENSTKQYISTEHQVLDQLRKNIERLKQSYNRLKEENAELFKQKQQLLDQLSEKEQYISKLKKQIDNLQISNALILSEAKNLNTENLQELKHKAKIKLNQIIRDIDKAIKQLSTYELQ